MIVIHGTAAPFIIQAIQERYSIPAYELLSKMDDQGTDPFTYLVGLLRREKIRYQSLLPIDQVVLVPNLGFETRVLALALLGQGSITVEQHDLIKELIPEFHVDGFQLALYNLVSDDPFIQNLGLAYERAISQSRILPAPFESWEMGDEIPDRIKGHLPGEAALHISDADTYNPREDDE